MVLSLQADDLTLFVVGVFAVWRLTHLLQAEDGPWDIVVWLRRAAGDGQWGRLMDCFYCLSVWIALPFAAVLGASWSHQLLLWPALSGAAIVLDRISGGPTAQPSNMQESISLDLKDSADTKEQ
jgi:hypothetical protein